MTVNSSASDHDPGGDLGTARVLAMDGREFIANAYRFGLAREPDAEGVEYYVRRLRNGASKRELLVQMYLSREARQKGLYRAELSWMALLYRIRKIPVIGWLVQFVFMVQAGFEAPRFSRSASSNATLVGEELRASLDAMEQRLTAVCRGTGGSSGAARSGAPADAVSYAALPGNPDDLTLEQLVQLSQQIKERNPSS